MPGTPEEYQENPDTQRAKELIDKALSEGKTNGDAIIEALMASGLRVYPEGAAAEPTEGEEMPEGEMLEEGPPLEGEEMPGDEGPMEGGELGGPGPSMIGGSEGGRRDVLIEAVRFGQEKDREKKAKNRPPKE